MKISNLLSYTMFLTISAATLTSCSTPDAQRYSNNIPKLQIQNFFNKNIHAHGIVLDRSGVLTRSFSIQMHGKWHGQQGLLQEQINYNDGKSQNREWNFVFSDPHHFTAEAKDAIGSAHGTQYGNSVHMVYTLNVPVDNTSYDINFDDWLYMTTGGKVINYTTLSKFGISLGKVIITYDR